MNYGHFSEDGREYIITNVNTPSPWINYIYNGRYFATISNNGGGISYYKSPLHGRITRYRINDVPYDRPGKYIYIKDSDTGEIWSLTWQPVGKYLDKYQVAHGFGYTRVTSEIEQIHSELVYFVPPDDDQEIWKSILTNQSDKTRNLSIFGYVELALGHALVDLINQCDDQHFSRVYFDKSLNSIFATKTYWVTETRGTQHQENKEWDQWAFFTSNLPITKYETVRERFIGLYRNENNPIAIENGNLTCKDTTFGNAIGAIQVDITLKPGESKDIIFSLGVIQKSEFEKKKEQIVTKYQKASESKNAYLSVINKWNEFFRFNRVKTPDNDFNLFMNYWTPYQAKVAFDIGRVASFYYWGIGRGFGYRDTSQDTIAITISDPEKAKERILLLARQMQLDGKVYHHFYGDGQGEFTTHCDDPLWFLLAVTEYIKETGDFSILEKKESFLKTENSNQTIATKKRKDLKNKNRDEIREQGTILDHMFAVVKFAKNNSGYHGLPIFGRGDWNDTLDYIGGKDGGESVWGGMFYVALLNLFIELLTELKLKKDKKKVKKVRNDFKKAVDKYCWDGEWYIRAFGEKQRKIGSKNNKYGKIFINSQSWAVIANISKKERQLKAMDSAKKHLDSVFGPKICSPAFKEIDPKIGLITRCVWGKKENGAIFNHPTAWLIQAECMLNRGNEAFDYYKKLLPNRIDSDTYFAEPYVYSQYITSDEHETAGRASHSWQTGTAAWMFRISLDYILGVRPSYYGLLIDPVIPSDWKSFKVERIFRGTRYIIDIENPNGSEAGISEIISDGVKIEGNIIPISDKIICQVSVRML